MDDILINGSADEVLELKTQFGLQNVTHNDDFMAVLENGPWLWQSNQLYTGYSGFYEEGKAQIPGDSAPPENLPELMGLKAIVEACLVLEEGVASTRAIDLGMMAGAGMDPRRGIMPPLMWADITGVAAAA